MQDKNYFLKDYWFDSMPYGECLVLEIEYVTERDEECCNFCYIIRRSELVERRKEFQKRMKIMKMRYE